MDPPPPLACAQQTVKTAESSRKSMQWEMRVKKKRKASTLTESEEGGKYKNRERRCRRAGKGRGGWRKKKTNRDAGGKAGEIKATKDGRARSR